MKTLHILPGDFASRAVRRAVQDSHYDDEVLSFRDDLSCGPIEPYEADVRGAWWKRFYETSDAATDHTEFWKKVAETDDRLIIWFGRHSARELAFFHAWTDKLGDRPYYTIDVTGQRLFKEPNGSPSSRPAQAVSTLPENALRSLLRTETPIAAEDREASVQRWRQLQSQNTTFRVVTDGGLWSAVEECFDPLLLENATPEWDWESHLIRRTIANNSEPYIQVGELMLLTRVVALVEAGKLLVEGDPWDPQRCRVRLPEPEQAPEPPVETQPEASA